MRIEIVRNRDHSWYWRIVAGNNRILAHSETYKKKGSALKIANELALRSNLPLFLNGKKQELQCDDALARKLQGSAHG